MSVTRVQRTLLGVALLFCSAPAYAQELNWAEKMFEKHNHDFGIVARGADVKHRINFTNKYVETIHISDVRTSCGCASAKVSQDLLASRETAYLEVTMDTRRESSVNKKESTVIITIDQPTHAVVRIPVTTFIRSDVVVTPGAAEFGAIPQGTGVERRISVSYAGRENWAVRNVICRNDNLDVKIRETSRGGGSVSYELTVAVKSGAPIGQLRDQVTLITDDANGSQIPVLVEGRIEAEYTITPEVVSFGAVSPGKKKTVNVVVRGKKPFSIEKIESERTSGVFEVRLPHEPRLIHVLPLTATGSEEGGSLDDEFTITIGGTGETILFKAFGRVVPETAAAPSAN